MTAPAQQSSPVTALPINELSSLFIASQNNVLIIGGYMNAQIGKNTNKFSLHNSSNKNGKHLTNFTQENKLTCHNTKFWKRKGKLCTYTYTDYILINNKWINSALNCEAYSSDHWIVMAKIWLSLCRNAVHTTKTEYYNWSLVNNRDISNKCTLTLRNKFDAFQAISEKITPNDEYENFVNAHRSSSRMHTN